MDKRRSCGESQASLGTNVPQARSTHLCRTHHQPGEKISDIPQSRPSPQSQRGQARSDRVVDGVSPKLNPIGPRRHTLNPESTPQGIKREQSGEFPKLEARTYAARTTSKGVHFRIPTSPPPQPQRGQARSDQVVDKVSPKLNPIRTQTAHPQPRVNTSRDQAWAIWAESGHGPHTQACMRGGRQQSRVNTSSEYSTLTSPLYMVYAPNPICHEQSTFS